MSRIVVVGGGFGGMASAARLAKLGHEVMLLEASDRLGGALGSIQQDGFTWDTGPTSTLLPAVIRDLFRKSGRAAEREFTLEPVEPVARHRFSDGTELDLPGGSRAAQLDAVAAALGTAAGERWVHWVDSQGEVWEALRQEYFERPWSPEHASKRARGLLESRVSLHKAVGRAFKDERLRELALHAPRLEGHDARNVPAWVALWSYVEQNFGRWTVPGGMGQLTEILTERLATRGVTVRTTTPVSDLLVESGRLSGVQVNADGGSPEHVPAEYVVLALDPRRIPALEPYVARTMPVIPPVISHLGIRGEVPDLPHEVVLHGDPSLVLRTNGTAPAGAHAWTVLGRGRLAEDIVTALARSGVRVRDQVEVRVDRSPRDLVAEWNGSPDGVLWQGRGTLKHRLGNRTPIDGVLLAGAHTTPGAGLPSVGLSAALVAHLIGPA